MLAGVDQSKAQETSDQSMTPASAIKSGDVPVSASSSLPADPSRPLKPPQQHRPAAVQARLRGLLARMLALKAKTLRTQVQGRVRAITGKIGDGRCCVVAAHESLMLSYGVQLRSEHQRMLQPPSKPPLVDAARLCQPQGVHVPVLEAGLDLAGVQVVDSEG